MRSLPYVLAIAAAIASGRVAHAQALPDFLAAGRAHALDNQEQAAAIAEREAERAQAGTALWPSISATASYTRNQDETVVTIPRTGMEPIEATIQPRDQLEASVTLNVPLLDLGTRRRIAAAGLERDAAVATAAVHAVEIDRAVVRAWFQWVGGAALVESAKAGETTAIASEKVVASRAEAGLASPVDVARARADVARARQAIADAELVVITARRTLRTLTGREPGSDAPALATDTSPEAGLDSWLGGVTGLPEVAAASVAHRAALASRRVEEAAWLPTVDAFARERLTNAAGFGDSTAYAAGVTATWRFDLIGTRARVRTAGARAATGAVRIARAEQDARDRITDAWNQVAALRARADAATAEAAAAAEALSAARTRLDSGTATALEVTTAQRDQLAADLGLVSARAELASARALLRLAAGRAEEL